MTNAITSRRRNRRRLVTGIQNALERHAALLDREADLELQYGHHAAAERLAHRAAEMREGAR